MPGETIVLIASLAGMVIGVVAVVGSAAYEAARDIARKR
jgi:hypothetical protein